MINIQILVVCLVSTLYRKPPSLGLTLFVIIAKMSMLILSSIPNRAYVIDWEMAPGNLSLAWNAQAM